MMRTYIFVPGYYGTTLIEEESGTLVWADPKEVMFGKKTLALPIPDMKVPGALNLKAHKLIEDVSLFGGLVKEDAYNKTMTLLRTLAGSTNHVEAVAWDWRLDPLRGVERLHEKVLEIKTLRPDDELILVSHSFGSVVAAYYLRYGIQDYEQAKETWEGLNHFSKIILSAAPFRGLMALFRDMHSGIKLFFNRQNQSPLAFCTFESSYYLLPSPGNGCVQDESLQPVKLDLHDPLIWYEMRWGFFNEQLKLGDESLGARRAYVSKHLLRAKKFYQLMEAPLKVKPREHKDLLYLSGHGHRTISKGVWFRRTGKGNIFLYTAKDFKKWMSSLHPHVVMGDGDGTVPDFSSELLPAFKTLGTEVVHEKVSHLGALQSPQSLNRIHEFLLGAK